MICPGRPRGGEGGASPQHSAMLELPCSALAAPCPLPPPPGRSPAWIFGGLIWRPRQGLLQPMKHSMDLASMSPSDPRSLVSIDALHVVKAQQHAHVTCHLRAPPELTVLRAFSMLLFSILQQQLFSILQQQQHTTTLVPYF